MFRKVRFFGSIVLLYVLTIGTLGTVAVASHSFGTPVWAEEKVVGTPKPRPLPPEKSIVSGKPVRIIIPSANIDLQVDDGIYDSSTQSWTLSETKAQFATMSAWANDYAGTTFIYGHGTDSVFGRIGTSHPPIGASAQIFTDNGHVFSYTLSDVQDFTPTDTSILSDTASGAPRLVVQTCTGIFSEWRTMFIFSFQKVEK